MSETAAANESLESWANGKIHQWLDLMNADQYVPAAELMVEAIRQHCRSTDETAPPVVRKFHFAIRVVFNGLRDLANLKFIVANSCWIESPKAVERVWHLAHDAHDRLSRISGFDADFLTHCLDDLAPILGAIQQRYGDGLYVSWETLFDYLECSICNADTRACDHVPGEWYGDQECVLQAVGMHPRAVALVERPHDLRCRIWPWLKRRSEGSHLVIEDIPVFIIFNPEGDEDGGQVVDRQELMGAD